MNLYDKIKSMRIFVNIVFIVLKVIFSIFFMLTIAYIGLEATLGAFLHPENLDWQISFFAAYSLLLIIGLWSIPYLKIQIIYKLIFIGLLVSYFYLLKTLPSIVYQLDEAACLEMGSCKEGVKWGKEIMNREVCLKNGWKWNEDRKSCEAL